MISVSHEDDFSFSSIEIARGDVFSDEGAAGAVDREYFEAWERDCSCTCLGQHRRN